MQHKSKSTLGLVHYLFIAAAFTSSFDVFLAVHLGFTFRISQALLLVPIGIAIINLKLNRIVVPLGFGWLLLWAAFIFLFVPNTDFLERSLGYAVWLLFNIFAVYVCVQFFSTPTKALILMRWYVYSFVFVAAFGLIQFASPLMGLGDSLLIGQWWIPGILPRLNGFSYEPSYFATYLLMGWVVCAYMLDFKADLFKRRHLKLFFFVISLALVLSSSRMGILAMSLWYLQYPLRFFGRLFKGYFHKRYARITFAFFGFVAFLAAFVIYSTGFDELTFLFAGLGIFGEPSHSVDQRGSHMLETFLLFVNSPLIGYSLGGVASAIAKLSGEANVNFDVAKHYEGGSIFLETLAASGIFGIIPFAIFVFLIIRQPLLLAQKISPTNSVIIVALTVSLMFELMILQLNQNILRPYLWIHIAVLASSYSAFSREKLFNPEAKFSQ